MANVFIGPPAADTLARRTLAASNRGLLGAWADRALGVERGRS